MDPEILKILNKREYSRSHYEKNKEEKKKKALENYYKNRQEIIQKKFRYEGSRHDINKHDEALEKEECIFVSKTEEDGVITEVYKINKKKKKK